MLYKRLNLRSVVKIGVASLAAKDAFLSATRVVVMALAIGLVVVSCNDKKNDNGKDDNGNTNGNSNGNSTNTVAAAFQQFGVDVEKIKPNVAAPDDVSIEYGNKVDATVYYRKAFYAEKSDTDIPDETGLDYNTRMFNYIKSISADGKCYTSYTSSDNPEEIAAYDKGTALIWNYTWGYKYNGMWVDVYMEYTMSGGKNIGIQLQGAGSY